RRPRPDSTPWLSSSRSLSPPSPSIHARPPLIPSPAPAEPPRTPPKGDRRAAAWHLAWGLGVGLILAVAALGWLAARPLEIAAPAVMTAPGLLGLGLWRWAGARARLVLSVVCAL